MPKPQRKSKAFNISVDLVITPSGVYLAPQAKFQDEDIHEHTAQPSITRTQVLEENDGVSEVTSDDEALQAMIKAQFEADAALRARKKEREWERWSRDIIPLLFTPYLALMRRSESLRLVEVVRDDCKCDICGDAKQNHVVTAVFFNRLEILKLCSCTPLSAQLIERGLFPCAPLRPTLAVDLQMLNFVQRLFVNSAPNITAWCQTVEGFLSSLSYKLQTMDTLRARFTNCLRWYSVLTNDVEARLSMLLDTGRALWLDRECGTDDTNDDALQRPSNYLRSRCPLCFGGSGWHQPDEIFDAIVCLDACFTQKRRKSQGNAWQGPHEHPQSVFLSKDAVNAMKQHVEELRPSQTLRTARNVATSDDADIIEPGLDVPESVLNECQDSFYAAEENRAKASTQFFADTGLMGLLCRHDRVLWLVNMSSAGEKQYYALALLEVLFQNIPPTMRIGVLYDIGCQLHRSCIKFPFLPQDILQRITFGISVFHAYGHQWPCQLIYHPRKCKGFGLSDGEGCERFWSSIKLLIPSLRVSSYYNRIYALDTQIKYLDTQSLQDMGTWLARKWKVMDARKKVAEKTLNEVGLDKAFLREQWKEQVREGTKPLQRQAKGLADKVLQSILELIEQEQEYKESLEDYENMLATGEYSEGLSAVEVGISLTEIRQKLKKTQASIVLRKKKLSIQENAKLATLMGNEFLRVRMNALALKSRIRERLKQRKFEIESLERAYRKTLNQQRLDSHTHGQIKRKEPGIQALARKYNGLCEKLRKLKRQHRAPRGAIVPDEIVMEGLFQLDVDDDIWQNIGLTDEYDDEGVVPEWLGNENVRAGIKALIELDRCEEDERRLVHERVALQEWMREEWFILEQTTEAMTQLEDEDLLYYLSIYRRRLVKMCLGWTRALQGFACHMDQNWGPSNRELAEQREYETTIQALSREEDNAMDIDIDHGNTVDIATFEDEPEDDEDDDDIVEKGSDEEEEEAELLDNMEQLALLGGYSL